VQETFLNSIVGPWNPETQRQTIARLNPPTALAFAEVDARNILVQRLTPAIRAAGAAAMKSTCCEDLAHEALESLIAAHQRAMLAFENGYQHSDGDSLVAARAALWQAIDGRDEVILAYVERYLDNSRLLAEGLQSISVAADERADAGKQARRLWPHIMDRVLDAVAMNPKIFTERTWGDYVEARLMPNPSTGWAFATIEVEEPHPWRDLLSWSPQVERWLGTITGSRMSIDALVIAVRELDVTQQIEVGLGWIEQIVARSGSNSAQTFCLPEWLHERRVDLVIDEQLARWQRIVDLLVVAGDARVADLAD
jgi:hypothetical protein